MIHINASNKIYYIIAALLVMAAGAGATASIYSPDHTTESPFIVAEEETDRVADADLVQNVITNMINGYVSVFDAREYISDEKFWTKQSIDVSAVEMEVNERYIDYCNAALDVTYAYSNYGIDSTELNEKLKIMQEKKDLI